MKKILRVMTMVLMMAGLFAYEPTVDVIKWNSKTSFVIKNPNRKWINNHFYIRVKISKDFTLEDFIDKEWHSLMYHRATCKYEWPSDAISDLMFITKENWKTITKQELYDLTFDFFKENTKLYKDAEKKAVYESENELSKDELKLIETLNRMNNKNRTLEETTEILEDMVTEVEAVINE